MRFVSGGDEWGDERPLMRAGVEVPVIYVAWGPTTCSTEVNTWYHDIGYNLWCLQLIGTVSMGGAA